MPATIAADIAWVVDARCVRVTRNNAVVATLGYPDAAVWDFLVRRIPRSRTVTMIRHIGGFSADADAAAFVEECLERWSRDGLVVCGECTDHGQPVADPALQQKL